MKQHHYAPMKNTILASMIVVPLIPFILALGVGYYYFTSSLESSTIASMKRIIQDHCHMINSFLGERKDDLELIQDLYTFEELSRPKKLQQVFEYLQKVTNAFVDLGIFNNNGVHVAYCGPYRLTGRVYSETDWFKEVMKKGYYISDIFLGYRGTPHFIIAIARDGDGGKWVIRATIDTLIFNNLVEKVRIGKSGEAYILNAHGTFQTKRRSGGNLMEQCADHIEYPLSQSDIKTFISKNSAGEKYLYATTWLKDLDWLLVIRQEQADAFKALRSAAYLIVLISLVGGGTIIIVAFYLSGRIVRRMEEMDAEKGRLSDQLIGAGRLAELGEMAAGFAHEINNPLQIIKNEETLIGVILSELKEKGQLKEPESFADLMDCIKQIDLQINRCAEITQAILKFGRQDVPVYKHVDVRSFIPAVTGMVAKKASVEGIVIKTELAENTPPIYGDPVQLQQVLLNLCNNAIDAIVQRNGSGEGDLVIKATPTEDGQVEISVEDNGCGISPDNLDKIFSPFFTTKPVGQGTGLGLSVCYGIIDKMGGEIKVRSEKGIGTTFTIILPAGV